MNEIDLLPEAIELAGVNHVKVRIKSGPRKLLYFGGCDYFRLARSGIMGRALIRAAASQMSVSASRMTTGNHPLYTEVEQKMARFFAAEFALIVSNGYLTNLIAAQGMAGDFGQVWIDARAHASLQDAALHLKAGKILKFEHRSSSGVAKLYRKLPSGSRAILLTDGMFPVDGAVAPLAEYVKVTASERVWLMIDDAHAAGVLGENGRGTIEHWGIKRERVIQTVTLGKAFGAFGGAIIGGKEFCRKVVVKSRAFTGSTPPPLPFMAVAKKSISILAHPRLRNALHNRCDHLASELEKGGFKWERNPGPILFIPMKDEQSASRMRGRLLKAGIYPSLLRYPGGGSEIYFRFVISSSHTPGQLSTLAHAVCSV
ncbi:MAG: pyridoxal phosphate-dependent aminotransferase family protein [Verrucomicrobiota bacterium]|nr:pyridoxal phosphate-dependent aminotransferase family protein [Verrucomicrobiota bacterium]